MGKMHMKLVRAVIDAFRNSRTRARAIIWLGTVMTALMLVVALGVSVTTTYWFCAAVCHYPQWDTVTSYDNSTHTGVACIACHKQPGGDPVSFLLFKVEALLKMPPSIARTAEIPLNPLSDLAMNPAKQPSKYCTQCHNLDNRGGTGTGNVEPNTSEGIIMDHWAHTDLNISCTACHNRVGHYQGGDWVNVHEPTQYAPGRYNSPVHDDFMMMTACYRCHRFEEHDGQLVSTPYPLSQFPGATGECSICHTDYFDLIPDNHRVPRFIEDIHGPWALEIEENVRDFIDGPRPTYNDQVNKNTDPESLALRGVPSVRAINYCYTCHTTRFCDDCHGGIRMPHPEGYQLQPHIDDAANYPDSCAICHVTSTVNATAAATGNRGEITDATTCSACHHGYPNLDWDFNTEVSWEWIDHIPATQQLGATVCFDCHSPTSCALCHVGLNQD